MGAWERRRIGTGAVARAVALSAACAALPHGALGVEFDTRYPAASEAAAAHVVLAQLAPGMNLAALDPLTIRLWDETFRPGSVRLTSRALADLEKVVTALREGRSEVDIVYAGSESNSTLVLGRIRFVEEIVAALWRARGDGRRVRIRKQWMMGG